MMDSISDIERDALVEIFNIGVGAAADVLSQMVREPVLMSVPRIHFSSPAEAGSQITGGTAQPLCAVRQTYSGEVSTEAILMFPERNSLELVRMMVGDELGLEHLTEMEQEAMAEIGNVILNAVVAKLGEMLNLEFDGSLPAVDVVSSDRLFSAQKEAQADGHDSSVLVLQIDFELSSRRIHGYLAFLLDLSATHGLRLRLAEFLHGLS